MIERIKNQNAWVFPYSDYDQDYENEADCSSAKKKRDVRTGNHYQGRSQYHH